MLSNSRPFSQREYHQKESNRQDVNHSCEFVPQCTMIRHEHLFNGMALTTKVFHLPIETIHLFRDIDSGKTPDGVMANDKDQSVCFL